MRRLCAQQQQHTGGRDKQRAGRVDVRSACTCACGTRRPDECEPLPSRAAAAHERGGLNPYHFFSVRHDRRKLDGEEEGKGEGLEAEEKKEIK